MKLRFLSTILLITMMIMTVAVNFIPNFPVIRTVKAAPPNNPALLGLFNEPLKTSAIITPNIGTNSGFVMDVNVTDAGVLKSFDIIINFTSPLSVAGSAAQGLGCPKAQGCLFDGLSITKLANSTSATGLRLSILDSDTGTPFVGGTGILFRITFHTGGTRGNSAIHIRSDTILQNPGNVPYKPIHGYFDNGMPSPVFNYPLSVSPNTATVIRKVSGTNSTPAVTVTVGTFTTTGSVNLNALGLPAFSSFAFVPSSGTAGFTSQFTITINGGAKGGPTTTPSGTYSIAIIGNSTVSGAVMEKSVWLKLVVKPPNPPVFTITASTTSFTQEAGNYTVFTATATLTSGANDSFAWGSNAPFGLNGGQATFNPSSPPSPSFPSTTQVNVTTPASGTTGAKNFNITVTTGGTYSEVVVTQKLKINVNVLRTHDLAAQAEASSRSFAYQQIDIGAHPINITVTIANQGTVTDLANVTLRAVTSLSTDLRISYVDTNGNGVRDPGEVVIYDSSNNGLYDLRMKYNDTNFNNQLNAGEAVVWDNNLNGVYDPKLSFVDLNFNGVWDPGEPVSYDTNLSGFYDSGEPAVNGTTTAGATLSHDPGIKYVDLNSDKLWESGEPVVYDANQNGKYDTGEILLAGTRPAVNTNVVTDMGELVINTAAIPPAGSPLKTLPTMKFVDSNSNGVWDSGEPVVVDANSNNLYDTGETVIAGTTPTNGTPLKIFDGEPVMFGTTPAAGTFLGSPDSKLQFVDSNLNAFWNPGEAVVYDSNLNGKYDAKLSFVDSNANGVWNAGEPVVYDTSLNGLYDAGEPVIAGSTPTVGTVLTTDPKVRFVDANANGQWDPGEVVVYDSNGNGLYDTGEPVIAGSAPTNGTKVVNDELVIAGPTPQSPVVGTQSLISMTASSTKIIFFLWNPSPAVQLRLGRYVFAASVATIKGEFLVTNNFVAVSLFNLKFKGDVNGDGTVDIVDLSTVGGTFGKTSTNPGFNPNADLNNDSKTDIVDLVLVAGNFGQKAP